ncbi:hypothetical protein AB4Y45_46110 [Paraburkholderia sp. EG287A]|uniref:hypothetical protein n=1 Tax=unclassified Paraburkholderia TaxID=2615204 RepID=UPI0034D3665A
MSAPMNPSDWIDHGTLPPQRLPAGAGDAIAYLADVLGHVVYTRWTHDQVASCLTGRREGGTAGRHACAAGS